MPTEESKGTIQKRRVTFKLKTPRAKEVFLMGDFNNWDGSIHPMKKGDDGVWKATIPLTPGRYEFKFLVDGRWWADIKKTDTVPNSYGTLNNVLYMAKK